MVIGVSTFYIVRHECARALRGTLSPFDNGKFDSKKNKKGRKKHAVIFSVGLFCIWFRSIR